MYYWRLWMMLVVATGGTSVAAAEPTRAGPDWWSLRTVRNPEPPKVRQAEWVRNPIDAFILSRLEVKGLEPAPAADPRVLIRRVTFDLIGLPPTPEEVDAFLRAYAAKPRAAYEALVDRLLASPHYGERWARHWLDAVRFSESNGFEYDRLRDSAWHYRDYVIRSFNDDKPYARFVKEQLAGDALTPASREGTIATGFLVAGPWDQAGHGAASLSVRGRAREDELEEMLSAVGQTFLGLTINCARCHDHKFDPLTAKDYYRFKAIFEGVWHGERSLSPPEDLQRIRNDIARQQARIDTVSRQIAEIEKRGRAKLAAVGKKDATGLPQPLARWTFEGDARDLLGGLHGTLKGGAKIENGRLILDGNGAFVETVPLAKDLRDRTLEAWVTLANLQQRGGAAITVEANDGGVFDAIVIGEKQPGQWIAGSNGFVRTRDHGGATETAKPNEMVHVAIVYSDDNRIAIFRNGEPDGEAYLPGSEKLVTFRANGSRLLFGKRHTSGGNPYLAGAIEEARLYDRALTADEMRASFKAGVERIAHREILKALTEDDRREHQRLEAELAKLRAALPAPPTSAMAHAATIRPPGPTYLLKRGDLDSKVEVVTAGPPAVIQGPPKDFGLPADSPEAQRRLRFADWVVHADNPLTWRVIVNRVWQHHFGDGIVRSPSDFGFNGERPTHPELLDWLAFRFREENGSLKKLHRLIVLSATYQQSSKLNPKAAEVDGDNRLLWRFAPRRLEAEAVRDAMLAVSGQLNRQAGGPGFRPFRIAEFNAAFYQLIDVDRPEFNRRSIYRINVNSGKDTLLDTLDCPDPSVKTPRRATTTTPLQALTMMNNSFVQRQARVFAERVMKEVGDDAAKQIASVYRFALGRAPSKSESERGSAVAKEHGLKAVCWAILNSSEFVYIR